MHACDKLYIDMDRNEVKGCNAGLVGLNERHPRYILGNFIVHNECIVGTWRTTGSCSALTATAAAAALTCAATDA